MIPLILLKRVIEENSNEINNTDIKRREVIPDLEKAMKMKEITVLSGIRRSGKSYLMYYLAKKFGGAYINFDDERLINFDVQDFDRLYNLTGGKTLFLDEVQNIKGWERFANRIQTKTKLVVSGSNSSLLSSEFTTRLTGRTITFDIYPLSYSEFLNFKNLKPAIDTFEKYLDIGGFPRIVETEEKVLIKEYFNLIIYKDIIPRFNIKHAESLRELAVYLISNIGKPYTYRSLTKVIDIQHEMTIKEYIKHIESAFLLSSLSRYHPSLRKREALPKKIYSIDPLFSTIGFSDETIRSRLLENVVYLHLIKLFGRNNVYYYLEKNEVDFLITKNMRPTIAINVAYAIYDNNTLKREIAGLLSLDKNIKKYLITLYPLDFDLPRGIKHISVIDFLVNAQSIEQKR